MKAKMFGLLGMGLLAGPVAAIAATIPLSAPSDFVGPTTNVNFDDVANRTVINTNYLPQGVEFQRDDGQAIVAYDVSAFLTTSSGTQTLATISVGGVNTSYVNHLNVLLDSPTFEIGAYVGNAFTTTLSLFDANGDLLGSYTVSDSTRDVDQFLGLRSTMPFLSARFVTDDVDRSVVLDDLMIGSGPLSVPEPGTLALLGLGLLGLGVSRRKV